ncbi:MAG TPA: biopolymer transporter ExbD [Phycisphaerales bacterium]|nr:biopolymer transporter ExbD [Phycisphaerales bacterium]
MNFLRQSRRTTTGFDMTPMIDVALQLIIFFLFTSQLSHAMRSPMDLPQERGDPGQADGPEQMVVDLTVAGTLLVEGQERSLDEVVAIVAAEQQRAVAAGGALDLLIRADRSCPAAHLNRLAASLADAGVRTWKLGTAVSGAEGGVP